MSAPDAGRDDRLVEAAARYRGNAVSKRSGFSVGAAIEDLSTASDFIIVDPDGAGVSPQAQIAATLSDGAIIVVWPGRTDENGLADLVNAITMLETPVIGVVTNRAKETNTSGRFYA